MLSLFAAEESRTVSGSRGPLNRPKTLYSITAAWVESTAVWDTPWKSKGGDFDTNSALHNTNESIGVWENYDITGHVGKWHANTVENNGVMLISRSHDPATGVRFHSSEATLTDKRPKLTIRYNLE